MIFGDFRDARLEREVDRLRDSSADNDRAVAANVCYDHRVSVARFDSFKSSLPPDALTVPLREAHDRYLQDYPDEYRSPANERNLPKDSNRYFVHLLRFDRRVLQALNRALAANRDYALELAQPSSGLHAPKELPADNWQKFHEWIGNLPENRHESVFDALVRSWSDDLNRGTRPVWATTDLAFEPYRNQPVDRWAELLGVRPPVDQYAILLAYELDGLACAYRPSWLESGTYLYHFPSPPDHICGPDEGGFTMDLGGQATSLIPEFVHGPTSLDGRHWELAERKFGLVRGRTVIDTEDLTVRTMRSRHHKLLVGENDLVKDWMPVALP